MLGFDRRRTDRLAMYNANAEVRFTDRDCNAAADVKTEMVKIPGGNFTMGRNDGDPFEKPEHEVEVKDFWMDKTEVTNAEYYQFVKATGYKSVPSNWENGKPVAGQEMCRFGMLIIDDIKDLSNGVQSATT